MRCSSQLQVHPQLLHLSQQPSSPIFDTGESVMLFLAACDRLFGIGQAVASVHHKEHLASMRSTIRAV